MEASTEAPERTAQQPFLPEEEDLLRNKIDQDASFEEIFDHFWKKSVMIDSVLRAIECNKRVLKTLFHTLHRSTLRSVLLKRIAYDFWDADSDNWVGLHKDTDAGAYVTSIHIRGRGGKFLTLEEVQALILHMTNYADAVDAFEQDDLADLYVPYSQEKPRTRALLDKAMAIDDQYKSGAVTRLYMGLTPLVASVPLFTCWADDQINPTEILGTILVRSMVDAYGFNVKQPGTWSGHVEEDVLADAKANERLEQIAARLDKELGLLRDNAEIAKEKQKMEDDEMEKVLEATKSVKSMRDEARELRLIDQNLPHGDEELE
ncbi:hypothetical protein SCUP515_04948 [Seiridium cupressi]